MDVRALKEKYNSTLDKIDSYYKSGIVGRRSLTASEKEKIVELNIQAEELKEQIQKAKEEARAGAYVVTEGEEEKRGNKQMTTETRNYEQELTEIRNMTTGTNGETVPRNFHADVIRKIKETSKIVSMIPQIESVGELQILQEAGEREAEFLTEVEKLTPVEIGKMTPVTMKDKRVSTEIVLSEILLNNSPYFTLDYLSEKIGQRLAFALEKSLLKPTGRDAKELTSGIYDTDNKYLTAQENILSIEDMLQFMTLVKPEVLKGAVMVVNRPLFMQLFSMVDQIGRPFMSSVVTTDGVVYKFLNVEILISEYAQDGKICLVNPSMALRMKKGKDLAMKYLDQKYSDIASIGFLANWYGDIALVMPEACYTLYSGVAENGGVRNNNTIVKDA